MPKILLTGGSGLLGQELIKYLNCDTPSHKELDVTKEMKPRDDYDIVIHAAAYTDVPKAEIEKEECFKVNVLGTLNMVKAFPKAKFIHISTEYVKNPVNFYSWTKVWAEEMVLMHHNSSLIIRTSFKPNPFPWQFAFIDQYTTADYVDIIAPKIAAAVLSNLFGVKAIGTGRKTIFELARRTKPDIKGISVDDIKDVKLPKDYE